MRILFFGRESCEGSRSLVQDLVQRGHDVEYLMSARRNQELSTRVLNWSGDLILSYRNLIVLPERVLQSATLAVNFHPGPPEYPGSGCVNFALLDDVKSYGVTCHVMESQVDHGTILEVRRFAVGAGTTLQDLLAETHGELLFLAHDFIARVSGLTLSDLKALRDVKIEENWSGTRRKISAIDALQEIRLPITLEELARRKRAIHLPSHPLYVSIFGYRFELREDE